jgi:xanthine/uracil permease
VALGAGVTQASDALCGFPSWMTVVFAKTPVVIAAVVSILLNLLLPKDKEER